MKSVLYLLSAALISTLFANCNSANPYDQTVFRLEEGPRPGAASRYGYRGTEGPQDDARRTARRTVRRDTPSNKKKPAKKKDINETTPRIVRPNSDEGEPDVESEVAEVTDLNSGSGNDDRDTGNDDAAGTGAGSSDSGDSSTASTEKKSTPAAGSKPYASPVPGKYGHVYSPFSAGREVNVEGFAPGTEVRCPYTQNIFRVP